MNEVVEFFRKLFSSADWPPRWHCGQWSSFHGWFYIISDLLIWSAYFTIPIVILRYISKKQGIRFLRLYFLFAAFILACGATHLLDAIAFWIPLYRLNALVRFITGVISWVTVFYLVKYLPVLFSLKPQKTLEAESELRRKSEEKFRGLLEAAPDAMVIANAEGDITLINRQTEILFGYTKEELIGKPVEILIPAKLHNRHTDDRSKYFLNPKVRSMGAGLELYAVKKDGTQFPVEISLSPLVTEEGTLVSASVRNITERKKAEEILSKARKDFQLLVSSVKDYAIFMLDTNGRIASWNNGAEYIKGYTAEEIIGKPMDIFYTAEEIAMEEPKRNLQTAQQQGHFETEGWRVRKDGSTFYANVAFTALIDDEGSLYGYAKVTKDITEKKKTEEHLRFLASIADNIHDPVISTDNATGNNFIITRWNKPAEKLLEWKSEEVMGKNAMEIFKTDYPYETREQIFELLKAKGFWQGEIIYHTKSGRPVYVLSTISYLKDAQGNITGNLVLIRDITKRKKAEEALSKLNAELEDRVKERTQAVVKTMEEKNIILESIGDAFFAVDKNWTVTYWNKVAETALVVPKHEILGKNLWEKFSDSIDSISYKKYHEAIVANEVAHFEDYYEALNKWYEISAYPSENGLSVYFKDISQRKEIEKNLAKSLKEIVDYKYALDESSIVAITDQRGIIKHANNNFCKISKYSEDELIGQDHRIINSGYHPKEFIRNLWVTIANGKIWKGELKNKAKDGTIYWVDTTIVPFLNEEGKPYQYVAIRSDITERKNAEENIKATLREISDYKYALDESSIVAITDQKGIIKYANNNFCKISKYSVKELMGQDHRIINSGYHPKEFIRNLWVTIANGKIWKGELKNKAKDGTIYWVDTTIVPFLNEEGKPYQYVAIRADITERKQVEENLQKSLKETADYKYALDESSIVAITDQKGIIKYANNNFCKISKYSVKELMGQDHRIINSGHHPKEFIKNLWTTIANGKIWKGELKNKAKDGTTYWVDTTIVPFLDNKGKPYQYVAIRADITERKKAEGNIIELNRDLEEKIERRTGQLKKSAEEMEAFSYSVSHDLRAPLRGIIGFANILEEDYGSKLDDEAKRITGIIKKNTSKMGQLIDDLLTFSRMGRQELMKTNLNTDRIVREIIDDLGLNEKNKKIKWIIHPLPPVTADINTINQVWINLISNAVKYSGNVAEPKIEIGSIENNGNVNFFIKDNGVGFDEKYKAKLFKVFQRLHSADEFEGTGIGLAIVDKIVDKHGGKVWAEGELNKGATFYFSLPVDKDQRIGGY